MGLGTVHKGKGKALRPLNGKNKKKTKKKNRCIFERNGFGKRRRKQLSEEKPK